MLTEMNNIPNAVDDAARRNDYMLQNLKIFKDFGEKLAASGLTFAVCDLAGNINFFSGNKFQNNADLIDIGLSLQKENQTKSCQTFGDSHEILGIALKDSHQVIGSAIIDCRNVKNAQIELLGNMLEFLSQNFNSNLAAEKEVEIISTELSHVYEELVLLHKLSTSMKITEPDANFLQMACDNLTDIVSVEGIAVLLEKTIDDERKIVLSAGSGLIDIDERMAGILDYRLNDEIAGGKEALLDSDIDAPLRYEWPKTIRNIIVVPLYGKDKAIYPASHPPRNSNACIIGMMVAINRIDKPDFDSTDVKLFNSVANSCAVFVENGRLVMDLKELFIGALKALTNSIDAKDQYTRGHSERVAFISRWLAEKVSETINIDQEEIDKIYLAGLLHDIGKVGIDEIVLRKKGKLTESELENIKKHPTIGASILDGIKQMKEIVPGILTHHEKVDGTGYPNRLIGNEIPLMGKIICLADCFDAMTSRRTYRNAMNLDEALEEIRKGLGTQFDEKIGNIFLESDVYQLWENIQNGIGQLHGNVSFSEFGRDAVGTLIK